MSLIQKGTGNYGKSKLSSTQQELYVSLEQSLINFMQSEEREFTQLNYSNGGTAYTPFKIDYTGYSLDREQAVQAWMAFIADHPWLFWLKTNCAYSSDV